MSKLRADIERYYELAGIEGPVSRSRLFAAYLNPRLIPNIFLRLSEYFFNRHLKFVSKFFSMLNVVLFGIEISGRVEIEGGLFLPHTVGTVIGAERIGFNTTIMQGVTLGAREPDIRCKVSMQPIVGNHVLIGAGAKIIGRVTIGDHAKIGANAVVLHDVPPHAVVAGIEARIVQLPQPETKNESLPSG